MKIVNNIYKSKGLTGLYHLINYARSRDVNDLSIIKDNSVYIKFWMLVTLMQNNHDLIFDEVDNDTLNDLFKMNPIRKNSSELLFDDGSIYDYGAGIKTNSSLDYRVQFKLIRNSIAHNDYEISDDGLIHIKNDKYNFEVIFDYKWFESAIVCSLSNRNYQFKSGLYDSFLVSLNTSGDNAIEHLNNTLKDQTNGIVKVTLTTNSLEKACKSLSIKYVEDLKFYTIFLHIKDIFQSSLVKYLPQGDEEIDAKKFNYATNSVLKELNTKLDGCFKLEFIPFTLDFAKDMEDNLAFSKITNYKEQIDILFNHFKRSYFAELDNTLSFKYLMDILNLITNNQELNPRYEIYLDDSFNFLIKSLGNLVFNVCLSNLEGYKTLSNNIYRKYKAFINMDFGHARNYYKDYLKKLLNALEDSKKNGFPFDKRFELNKMKDRVLLLENKIDSINKGENPEVFFTQLRNIFAHGYSKASKSDITLYDRDIKRYYYKFSKSKRTWEEKELGDSPVIFNMNISLDKFLEMIKDICKELHLEVEKSSKFNELM